MRCLEMWRYGFSTDAALYSCKAKILRMEGDTQGAIAVLQAGLKPDRPHTFAQADGLVSLLLIFWDSFTECSVANFRACLDTYVAKTVRRSSGNVHQSHGDQQLASIFIRE